MLHNCEQCHICVLPVPSQSGLHPDEHEQSWCVKIICMHCFDGLVVRIVQPNNNTNNNNNYVSVWFEELFSVWPGSVSWNKLLLQLICTFLRMQFIILKPRKNGPQLSGRSCLHQVITSVLWDNSSWQFGRAIPRQTGAILPRKTQLNGSHLMPNLQKGPKEFEFPIAVSKSFSSLNNSSNCNVF